MIKVLRLSLTIDKDVVKVDDQEPVQQVKEGLVHKTLERARCVGQSEWHNNPFEEAETREKG